MEANSLIHITKSSLIEIPIIRHLGEATFYPTYLPIIGKAQVDFMFHQMYSEEALYHQITNEAHHFFIAFNTEKPIGFASCELNVDNSSNAKLHKLYVLPSNHTKGVGKQLLKSVELFATQNLQKGLLLNVNRYNKAKEFYTHLGYSIILEEDIEIGNGYFMNDYKMKKSLT